MSKWILFVLALGLPFFGQAEPKVEQKSKTTLAIGKAVGEFSWSETDETGQSLMLFAVGEGGEVIIFTKLICF